jgi:hypothetical protein
MFPFLSASAHPGNTDSSGCHTCRTNCSDWGLSYGEYHCHNNKGYSQPEYPVTSTYGSGGTGYTSPAPNYAYPSIPSCPLNSYYDGLSSCKCSYGYVVSGSSCVSANSMCWNQTGYNSSYDSLSSTCKCDYGYIIGSSGTCINADSYCSDEMGIMSEYDNLSKKCQCMIGYEFDGSSCVYKKSTYSYPSSNYDDLNTCPTNSHVSNSDATKCNCDTGYQVNSTGDSCVVKVTKTNSQVCQDGFGTNVDWDGTYDTSSGQLNCNCKSGYIWNILRTGCILAPAVEVPVTPVVKSNMVENNLKNENKSVEIKKQTAKKAEVPKKDIQVSTITSTNSSPIKSEEKKGWWSSFIGWLGFK